MTLPTNALHPNQTSRLPAAQYTVVAGDTLYNITRRHSFQQAGKVPHLRVVRGYDDASGYLIMSDSLSGPNVALTERDFGTVWNTQGRQYLPVRRGPGGFSFLGRCLFPRSVLP